MWLGFTPRVLLGTAGTALLFLQGGAVAQSGDSRVAITGGPDAAGQSYTWTVANQSGVPIVGVDIPHFRGGLFTPPQGWSADCTNLVGVGVADIGGICKAAANSPRFFITRPNTATFHLQLAAKGAKRGVGEVRIHFADGTDALIGQVIVPTRESFAEKFSPVIGLAIIGGLLIVFGGRRKQRKTSICDTPSSSR